MRAIILAVLVAVGIGLSFAPTVYAAPASGFAIGVEELMGGPVLGLGGQVVG